MRADLPGTKHTKTLERDERAILEGIQRTPGVRKVETLWFTQTGPTHRLRLRLRPALRAGIVEHVLEAFLFIGGGKRLIVIIPEWEVTLEVLAGNLRASLARYDVHVEIMGGEKMADQHMLSKAWLVLTLEKHWPIVKIGYGGHTTDQKLEEEELELQYQREELDRKLEDVRNRRRQNQLETLEAIAGVLGLCQQPD